MLNLWKNIKWPCAYPSSEYNKVCKYKKINKIGDDQNRVQDK